MMITKRLAPLALIQKPIGGQKLPIRSYRWFNSSTHTFGLWSLQDHWIRFKFDPMDSFPQGFIGIPEFRFEWASSDHLYPKTILFIFPVLAKPQWSETNKHVRTLIVPLAAPRSVHMETSKESWKNWENASGISETYPEHKNKHVIIVLLVLETVSERSRMGNHQSRT